MNSLTKRLLKAALILVIFTFFISCGKEKPTLVKIRVIDTNNESVSDARVILCPCPNPVLGQTVGNDTLYTDDDGWAIFDYTDEFDKGTAGFRVLNIEANYDNTLFGEGIVKLYEEETNIQAVVVNVP